MPENTILSMAKRSTTSCVVIAALTMLMPLRNNTTGLPSMVPVSKVIPLIT